MVAAPADGETDRSAYDGELERWVFSFGIETGVFGSPAEAEFSGSPIVGPRATNISLFSDAEPNIVAPRQGSADIFAGLLGPTFGLMTPAPVDLPTQPRFFMDLSVLAVLSQETSVARLGDPGEFRIRDNIPQNVEFVGERLLEGVGTQVTSQPQGIQLYIAMGPAFSFDWGEDRIRIKPGIEYSRMENKLSVQANRAIRILDRDPRTPDGRDRIRSLDHFRLLALSDDFTDVYHGLGPSLEIEYETDNRLGPFLLSVFLKAGASHLFGDLKTEFLVANPEYPRETVRFKYKNDRWAYRGSTGIRFRFVPKSKR